jgi:ABC-type transporter Mla subunit MlaD
LGNSYSYLPAFTDRFSLFNNSVNNDLPDIMTNVNEICDSLNNTVQKVESTVDDVVELEQIITNEIKEPLKNIAQAIAMLLQLANKLFDRKAK